MKLNPLSGVGFLPILSFSALLLGKLAASVPLTAEPFNQTISSDESSNLLGRTIITPEILAAAKKEFPKIDWDFAVADCSGDQFLLLQSTTRDALKMVDVSGDWFGTVWYSAGFNRFFRASAWWKGSGPGHAWDDYAPKIWNKMRRWPVDPPAKDKRVYKTRYYCNPEKNFPGHCAAGSIPAFTAKKHADPDGTFAHSTYFCPLFWLDSQVPSMSALVAKGYRSPFDIIYLTTREHVLIHEWLHNPKIDEGTFHIGDEVAYINSVGAKVYVYGPERCASYAWQDTSGYPKYATIRNADSWAWMVSYNYFISVWGWSTTGAYSKRELIDGVAKRQDDTTVVDFAPDGDDDIDADIEPSTLPDVPDGWCSEGDDGCAYPGYDISDIGGCWLSEACRYPNDDDTVSADCTCECDMNKGDGDTTTVSYPISDPMCTGWDGNGPGSGGTPGSGGQQVGIAAYIPPSGDPDAWTRMTNYDLGKLSVLVVNALNGPDNTVNTAWEKVINAASGAGKTVIGYVRTGYLGQSTLGFTTRLGSNELADWVSQIEIDVDLWYSLYPGKISGIFFDEGWNSCGTNNQFSELYRLITENTKRKYPGAFTVLNPGATMPQCFENSADTLMTFESSYETYTNSYVDNGWTAESTQKIWHIIYNVPSSAVATVAALAKDRGAGFVQITDDTLPNPYDTLPNDAYMQTLLAAMEGGTVEVAEPESFATGSAASTPGGLAVTATDYSSVSLSWSTSANAISYKVYVNGVATLNLASYMTAVTVGNLKVGTSGFSFQISAVGGGGTESSLSGAVTASTNSPASAGKYIINAEAAAGAASTVYQADVLIPYAYVRLYITSTVNGFCASVGWTINYNANRYVCALAMIESGILYGYSGTTEGEWSWTNLGAVTVTQDHYHFTWNVPLGTSTMDTNNYVIQTEGYGPLLNYFHPCPMFAEDDTYCSGTYNGS